MRTSLIALVALIASPLLVLAVPSSQMSSLTIRDLVPFKGDFLGDLGDLTSDQIVEHIDDLTEDGVADLSKNLTDGDLDTIVEKVKDHNKLAGILKKLGKLEKLEQLGLDD